MNTNLLRRLDQLARCKCAKVPPLDIILDFTDGKADPEKIYRFVGGSVTLNAVIHASRVL